MEVLLRCQIPDRRGMLSTLAGAIAEAGGDIQAVEVVESRDGTATDDLWVVTDALSQVVERVESLDGVTVVHAGMSRGIPGDATIRLATGLEAMISGAMPAEDGLVTLIGGLLHADQAEIEVGEDDDPPPRNRRVLRLAIAGGTLVLRREYRFLDAEAQRARDVLAVCERAVAIANA